MRIRMLTGLSGSAFSLAPGSERDFPDDEAIRLIEAGFAVPVAAPNHEKAVSEPVIERRGKRGRPNVVSSDGDVGGG